jgi:hypothetical protein
MQGRLLAAALKRDMHIAEEVIIQEISNVATGSSAACHVPWLGCRKCFGVSALNEMDAQSCLSR